MILGTRYPKSPFCFIALLTAPSICTANSLYILFSTAVSPASVSNRPLISPILSHQRESSHLIGGFKPVDMRVPATPLQERFLDSWARRSADRKTQNLKSLSGKLLWNVNGRDVSDYGRNP